MTERDFERARRKATWNRIIAFVTGKPSLLLPFELVRSQVSLKSASYEGIREIPIDRVIGSVNRYHEFDREFLPKTAESRERWSNVRRTFDRDIGFPPIKVYRVGEAYFVVDGNHRVSVARQLGIKTIEAEVVDFRPNVPIDRNTNIPDLIIKREYSDFLRQTRLDRLRPEQRIEFTRPGRYAILLEHIAKRRYFLGLEKDADIAYEEAVVSWYDGLYRPLVEILREEHLLDRFPGRTEADLYVWISRHLYFLREQQGDSIGLSAATKDFAGRPEAAGRRKDMVRRARQLVGRLGGERATRTDSALAVLEQRLAWMERRKVTVAQAYRVPARWLDSDDASGGVVQVGAVSFWRSRIEEILAAEPIPCMAGDRGDWSRRAVVYNLFVRATCAYDHDGDGRISVLNRQGVRETGTFVKAIALLPYIRSLGCNTVHLLPVSRIGRDGRKGSLGSPYAMRNPYQLDETLSEPVVRLGPDVEFRAFVEAAHRMGIRVVLEFVFRTAAKDSEWIGQHPEWFYWTRQSATDANGAGCVRPTFPESDLKRMRVMVERGDFDGLPAPPTAYRALYAPAPSRDGVRFDGTRYVGTAADGTEVRIPGAFADWPPDDAQPPWRDVTYLRLYRHPDFNYMAYNTIRMYDARLARPENEVSDLWEHIVGVLPHFQSRYGIDGAMIDMGHALPPSLKQRIIAGARGADPCFALWDEDFEAKERSRREGYNAVIGNYWWLVHRGRRLRQALALWAKCGLPLPIFATPETHNTPRCAARTGGVARSVFAWVIGAFLPAVPVVHSGFELAETVPVNTGLDFTVEDAARFSESELPLYSESSYPWNACENPLQMVRETLGLRHRFENLVINPEASSIEIPPCDHPESVAYVRKGESATLLVVGNPTEVAITVRLRGLRMEDGECEDALGSNVIHVSAGETIIRLSPWQCAVFVAESVEESAAR